MINPKTLFIVCVVVAMIVQIVALILPYWTIDAKVSLPPTPPDTVAIEATTHWGIWQLCGKSSTGSSCQSLPLVDPELPNSNALLAMQYLTILPSIFALMSFAYMYVYPGKKSQVTILMILAALSSLAACVVWLSSVKLSMWIDDGKGDPVLTPLKGKPGLCWYLNLLVGLGFAGLAVYVWTR